MEWTHRLTWLGDQYLALVQACLQWSPSHRLSASEALQHSFFIGGCLADAKSEPEDAESEPVHADAKSEPGHVDAKSELGHVDAKSESGSVWTGPQLAAHMEKEGYIVLPSFMDTSNCEALVQEIKNPLGHP